MIRRLVATIAIAAATVFGQTTFVTPGAPPPAGNYALLFLVGADPSGTCVNQALIELSLASGNFFSCYVSSPGSPGVWKSPSGSGGGSWGSITGTLSSQADLNTALAGKAPLTGATFTGAVAAPSFIGGLTGNVTGSASGNELPLTFTSPLARSTNTISLPQASGSSPGYLAATDYTNFSISATTVAAATALNTGTTLVKRDSSGNFAAGTITAALTGNASTATALASAPSKCSAGQASIGVDANGNAQGCFTPSGTGLGDPGANGIVKRTGSNTSTVAVAGTDYVVPSGNVSTATALAATPAQCGANNWATGVTSMGTANCLQPAASNLSNGVSGSGSVVLASGATITGATLSNPVLSSARISTTNPPYIQTTSGGTITAFTLVAFSGTQVVQASTGTTCAALVALNATTGSGQNVQVASTPGTEVSILSDNATTAGDLVGCSTTTGGYVTDLAQTSELSVPYGYTIIGRALNAVSAGTAATVLLRPIGSTGGQFSASGLTSGHIVIGQGSQSLSVDGTATLDGSGNLTAAIITGTQLNVSDGVNAGEVDVCNVAGSSCVKYVFNASSQAEFDDTNGVAILQLGTGTSTPTTNFIMNVSGSTALLKTPSGGMKNLPANGNWCAGISASTLNGLCVNTPSSAQEYVTITPGATTVDPVISATTNDSQTSQHLVLKGVGAAGICVESCTTASAGPAIVGTATVANFKGGSGGVTLAAGAALGTSPPTPTCVSAQCTNISGIVSVTVGTSPPTGTNDIFTITWGSPNPASKPSLVISRCNATAATMSISNTPYYDLTNSSTTVAHIVTPATSALSGTMVFCYGVPGV